MFRKPAPSALLIYPASVQQSWCPHGSERDAALRALPPGLCVDVGAFDGADAIQYATAGHRVVSLEASPQKADVIKQRLRQHGVDKLVTFYPYAAGNRSGTATFIVHKPVAEDVGDANFMNGNLGSQQDAFGVPWTQDTHRVEVPVRRLDELIAAHEYVHFMKVDAQGFDYYVLQGAERLLRERRVRILQIEFAVGLMPEKQRTALALLQLMHSHGYRCASCGDDPGQGEGSVLVPTDAQEYIRRIAEKRFMHRGVNHGSFDDIVCY